ncbi:hypothetical protein BJV82DRAFT_669014 [Fennellomyces sp. T-0311]|nr:hypothetical protein BJV82DRAFT_669014 [Fennellomyces sp. T-0311]
MSNFSNVEQNPLVVALQSFSTVTSSLQTLTNEISSLKMTVQKADTTISTLTQKVTSISVRCQELEHQVQAMELSRNTVTTNTEAPAVSPASAPTPFKDMAIA